MPEIPTPALDPAVLGGALGAAVTVPARPLVVDLREVSGGAAPPAGTAHRTGPATGGTGPAAVLQHGPRARGRSPRQYAMRRR
ncbi:hypothetical protein CLV92_10146 [Kineococcus xinjiangensis]|uniref:Uncharacterized protein n=1 Tax=Kineococcus xinjiangensis TaxID=512762 RepID=A0A2S6IW20_9ACTN|nr:hypothetical protein [Kineococcus xinjiangensis]PPK98351.1 hypothetical protein CLV92_10146 [Kineococcus xinjiangensis]